EFHLAIIEASHNIIMLHTMRAMFDLLRAGVFYNRQQLFRQRATRDLLLDQHRAINDAIQARDPALARAAAENHMSYVEQTLSDLRKADRNEGVAQLRYQHELARE
ncbi:MAG: FCD domain-containing protein, partial [Pararhodobacter sp.]